MINKNFINKHFLRGKVTIVCGQPVMGKSSFAISLALSLAQCDKKSVFFSLEMSEEQLFKKIKMQVGNEHYKSLCGMIHVNDLTSAKLSEIERQLESIDVNCVIIDYLQLIDSEYNGSRSEEVQHIMDTLKHLAEKYDVIMVVLCQTIREWLRGFPRPNTWGKRPTLSSFGPLYSEALQGTHVVFLHRPEYYKRIDDTSGKNKDEEIEFLTYNDDICFVSLLYFNKETTEISI